jgi:hypothetical protein
MEKKILSSFLVPSTLVSQTETKPKIKKGKGQGILDDGVMIGNGI